VHGRQDFTLPSRSSITYKLTGGSQAQAGWIVVSEILSDTISKGSIAGILTFRFGSGARSYLKWAWRDLVNCRMRIEL